VTTGDAFPIADAPSLGRAARRTALLLWAVVAALGCAGAIALVTAPSSDRRPGVAAAGSRSSTIVVLDVSGSVTAIDNLAVGDALHDVASHAGRGGVGLVVFSDAAEVALPPQTPPAELLRFLRYYRTSQQFIYDNRPPWSTTFSLGTRISTGLAAARRVMEREHLHGEMLLISDLGDAPDDIPAVRREVVGIARDGIQLRIARLAGTTPEMRSTFRSLVGSGGFLPEGGLRAGGGVGGGRSWPLGLVIAAAVAGAVLAAVEIAAPLRWGRQ
jgi:hypothetical protein